MRPTTTPDVSRNEWRWVALWAGIFVILTLVPYAIAVLFTDDKASFMGILANHQDGATYFAKIREGMAGRWLYELQHTPQDHDPAGLFLFYITLGHAARILGFSPFVVFHLARIAASFFMFTALYRLGAHVWQRPRPRRLFFLLTSVASGLGWLFIPFLSDAEVLPPDFGIPEAFPLYAAYANPHFPLSIGCIAMLTGIYLMVFRPGYTQAPTAENGGSLVLLYSVTLALIQPPALVGIGGALLVFVMVSGYTRREIPWHEIRWASMMALPALPVLVYYIMVFSTNDLLREFNEQNVTPSPNILLTIIGYGFLLIIAAPGINRAVRRFVRDGDQFMLIWLVVNIIAIYMPHALQRRFFIGLIIPIGYFAVRSLEDYWFQRIRVRWQQVLLVLAFVFMIPSNLLVIAIPLTAIADTEAGEDTGILLNQDYIEAFAWLNEFGSEGEVVLSAPRVGLWIPAETPLRPVFGHPFETVPGETREQQVEDFFAGRDCETLLASERPFDVDYVLVGPQELKIRTDAMEDNPDEIQADCIAQIISNIDEPQAVQTFGDVTLYTLRRLR